MDLLLNCEAHALGLACFFKSFVGQMNYTIHPYRIQAAICG